MSLPRSNTVLENQEAENVKRTVNQLGPGQYITLTDNEGTYQKLITKEFIEQVNSKNFVPQITNADMAEHKLNIKNGYTMKVDNGRAYYVLDGKNRELVLSSNAGEGYIDKPKGEIAVANVEVKKGEPGAPPIDFDSIRKKRLARYGKRRQGGVLRYPAELMTEHTDYLQIDIERYAEIGDSYISDTGGSSRYVIGSASQNRAGRSRKLSRRPLINAGTILLPIPAQIQDTNNVVYGDSKMNGLAAAGVEAVAGLMSDIGGQVAAGKEINVSDRVEEFKTRMRGLGGSTSEQMTTAADIVTKKLAAEAVNIFGANVTVNQLLARGTGEILNPNMELLFSDVTIRNFRFSFKLTPRNPREAEQVKLIIRAFKRNMAPQAQGGVSGSGNFFLRAPNVFKLRYRSGNRDHPFLNKFKQCFLTDMQTTYTGDGVYSTYDDGTPVSMQLDLSFKELQPIYDIDYDAKPGNGAVGY